MSWPVSTEAKLKLLLDTCTFLWLIWDSDKLSPIARKLFLDPANEVFLSSVSCWEISMKYGLGKLPLPEEPGQLVPAQREIHGIESLALSEDAALRVNRLPTHHRDPFDRMLISQAIGEGMTILTPDRVFHSYPVQTSW